MDTKRKIELAAAMSMLFGLASGSVQAFPCSQGWVDGTQNGSSDNLDYSCFDGPVGDKNDSSSDLNSGAGYFGHTDWLFIAKDDPPGGDPAGAGDIKIQLTNLTTVKGDVVAGYWDLFGLPWYDEKDNPDGYEQIVFVLKDGKYTPPPDGIFWSAYLVTFGDMSGDWSMPDRNLSHWSVYGRGGGGGGEEEEIPEPGPLALFGSGLMGLYWVRRRLASR